MTDDARNGADRPDWWDPAEGDPTEADIPASEPSEPVSGSSTSMFSSAPPGGDPSWSTPTGQSLPDTPEPAQPPVPRSGPGGLVIAIVALVSALIGGGVVAVFTDSEPAPTATADRSGNSSVITRTGDVQAILAQVEPGVVSIQTEQFQRGVFGEIRRVPGAGTGMVLTDTGDVLTNAHVVAGAQRIEVTFSGEKDARPADLVGADSSADVAIIRIRNASGLPTVKLGSSKELAVGDDVIAIGNALALAGGLSVTQGIVSALNRSLDDDQVQFNDLIQTDAAINNGNSGGPLVNAAGEVVGINTVVIQQSGGNLVQNVGFAIAIDSVKPLIEQIRAGTAGDRRTAYLGVTMQTVDAETAEQLDLDVDEGALIVTVTPGSPAEAAGLERFDVITRFGDRNVASAEDITTAVVAQKPGDEVEVEYRRAGRRLRTTVTLGSRQASRQ